VSNFGLLVEELQQLRLSTPWPECFFRSVLIFNKLCRQFHGLSWHTGCVGIVENLLLGLRGNSWWRSNVLRDNEQKEANDSEIISDREVWSAIHYLDPESESDRRKGNIVAAIAVLAIICMLCTVIVYLQEL
jgi:hypothetical protein